MIRNSNVEVDIIEYVFTNESTKGETFVLSIALDLQLMMHLHLYRRCSVTYKLILYLISIDF